MFGGKLVTTAEVHLIGASDRAKGRMRNDVVVLLQLVADQWSFGERQNASIKEFEKATSTWAIAPRI
jgi:hypothetical protein